MLTMRKWSLHNQLLIKNAPLDTQNVIQEQVWATKPVFLRIRLFIQEIKIHKCKIDAQSIKSNLNKALWQTKILRGNSIRSSSLYSLNRQRAYQWVNLLWVKNSHAWTFIDHLHMEKVPTKYTAFSSLTNRYTTQMKQEIRSFLSNLTQTILQHLRFIQAWCLEVHALKILAHIRKMIHDIFQCLAPVHISVTRKSLKKIKLIK